MQDMEEGVFRVAIGQDDNGKGLWWNHMCLDSGSLGSFASERFVVTLLDKISIKAISRTVLCNVRH